MKVSEKLVKALGEYTDAAVRLELQLRRLRQGGPIDGHRVDAASSLARKTYDALWLEMNAEVARQVAKL